MLRKLIFTLVKICFELECYHTALLAGSESGIVLVPSCKVVTFASSVRIFETQADTNKNIQVTSPRADLNACDVGRVKAIWEAGVVDTTMIY